jgi:hypothetical protein
MVETIQARFWFENLMETDYFGERGKDVKKKE